MAHVNAAAGDVNAQIQFKGAAGQRLEVVQQGKNVYVRNLDKRSVSRIDATALDVHSGQSATVSADDQFAANASVTYDVSSSGTIRRLDAITLRLIGVPVHVRGPVSGAVVDSHNVLWIASKGTGELVSVRGTHRLATLPIAPHGSDLKLALVGGNVVVIDQTHPTVFLVVGGQVSKRITLPGVRPGTALEFPLSQQNRSYPWSFRRPGR